MTKKDPTMTGEKDNFPGNKNIKKYGFSELDSERAAEIGRKGGSVRSPEKKLAAKLRWLRRQGTNSDLAKHLHEIMTESSLSALDQLLFLENLKKEPASYRNKIELGKLMVEWHKMHHGVKNKNENLNINVNVPIEEWERRLMGEEE